MEKNLSESYNITIVGFGATGVSFLKYLQSLCHEQDLRGLRIAIVSEEQTVALGKAFKQCDEIHRVNTPPELMSIEEEDLLGFKHWLDAKENKEKYPPRHFFAEYLQETFDEIKQDKIFAIDVIESEAVDINEGDEKILEVKTLIKTIQTRKVVLCLGALSATNFREFGQNLILPHEIANLSGNEIEEVAIAGMGLTAVDCIRHLRKKGAKKVYIFSRKNMLPTPITTEHKYVAKHFVWQKIKNELISIKKEERLNRLLSLFQQELALLDENEYIDSNNLLSNEKYDEYFTYILEKANNANLPIQDILVSTRRFAHKIWKLLSDEDKVFFQKEYSSVWAVWRHPIPPFILEEIQKYFQTGFVEVIKSATASLDNGQVRIVSDKTKKIVRVESLVDATGGTINIEVSESLLIQNLLAKNIITPHVCGGIRTNSLNFRVKNKSGLEIYNLGPLAKGDLLSTNAFWYNSKCANELAYILVNALKEHESV